MFKLLAFMTLSVVASSKKSTSYQYGHLFHDGFLFDEENTDSKWLCIAFGLCSISTIPRTKANDVLTTMYQWGNLEYDYPSEAARTNAIKSGEFIPENGAPIDIDIYYADNNNVNKLFVAIPRFQNGIPATLATVTNRVYKGNPVIAPFPSWSWHQNSAACARDRLVSVFRVKIDECQRLWILDTGKIGDDQLCPAQIIAFDLRTNKLIHRYEIPSSQLQSNSILVTPIVDVRDPQAGCRDTFVYVADCQAFSLIVYDVQRGTSWKIVDKTMYPNPFYGTYNLAGYTFDLMDGILGMDLSPYKPSEDRILYFHAMSSGTEQWVYTSYLRNQSLYHDNPSPVPEIFRMYSGYRHTQCPAMAIDKNGIAYFGLVSDTSINCWNTRTDYGNHNIGQLVQDSMKLQFPSGVKVINNQKGKQELWFVTMRFQRMATGTLDVSDINFRIMVAKIEDLTKGSKCLNRPRMQTHNNLQLGSYGHSNRYGGGYGYVKSAKRDVDASVYFPTD